MLETAEIEAIIPHRYPFLLVDRITEIDEGRRGVGLKSVSANEWFFQGHFPGSPIMPGVLIVEALAQVACVTLMKDGSGAGKTPLFGGIEKMRFRRPVRPGDQLQLEFELKRLRGPVGRGHVRATVGGEVAAEGDISFALADLAGGGSESG